MVRFLIGYCALNSNINEYKCFSQGVCLLFLKK